MREHTGPIASVDGKPPAGILRRRCACGNATPMGKTCDNCSRTTHGLQRKLTIGSSNDPLEAEADRAAETALAQRGAGGAASAAPIGTAVHSTAGRGSAAPASVDEALAESGQPLPQALREDMEARFRHDFSAVRVHAGSAASRSASDVQAAAFTIGRDIVFGASRFDPSTSAGRSLLAHELAHVVQQGAGPARQQIQRDGTGELRLSEACTRLEDDVRRTPAFVALSVDGRTLAEEVIAEAGKRPVDVRHSLLLKLEALFITPVKPLATISAETKASTVTAESAEKKRLAVRAQSNLAGVEEKASKDPKRAWTPIKGKFGGGTYHVDRSSPTQIFVKATVYLHATGTGTIDDVRRIKAMEDAIEKAASTKGYSVDVNFVGGPQPGAFDVEVDPSRWEDATNWSGGKPLGFAHELHHMFAFELDAYDYIETHTKNESMQVVDRLIWFRKELSKPANHNDPTSIMSRAEHPNDSDVCSVSGMDMKACLDARQKAKKP